MKKIITSVKAVLLIVFLSQFFAHSSFGQIKIGAKGGLNLSNISGGNSNNYHHNRFRPGIHLGVYGHYTIKDKMGIQVEALFSQKGTITRDYPDYFVRINYLDFPVLFTYEFVSKFTAHAGLQLSAPVGAHTQRSGYTNDYFISHLYKPVFSIPVGVTYELDNGLNFGARADLGISAIGGDGGKNYVFMFSLGYTFYKGSITSSKK